MLAADDDAEGPVRGLIALVALLAQKKEEEPLKEEEESGSAKMSGGGAAALVCRSSSSRFFLSRSSFSFLPISGLLKMSNESSPPADADIDEDVDDAVV